MFRNFITIALRNLRKNRMSSIINIAGLGVGMAVPLLIGLWIRDEVSFDSYHRNHAHIAKVMDTQINNGSASTDDEVPIPLENELSTKYGQYFNGYVLTTHTFPILLTSGDKKLSKSGVFVEPGFPSLFTLKVLSGNQDVLKDPSSMMISASLAKSMFGEVDPLDKTINIDGMADLKVAAVYEDLPVSSTFSGVDFLGSFDKAITISSMDQARTQWGNHSFFLYLSLKDNVVPEKVNSFLKQISKAKMGGQNDSLFLHPMSKWHLYSDFKDGKMAGGRIEFVWLFGIVGAFVLFLACINFMNLSTARSERRAKEVGIRKAIGSLRGQLVGQFLSESLFMALLALVVAVMLVYFSLPYFNQLSGKEMRLPLGNLSFWALMLGFALFTGLVSGSYPAFYLSAAKPISVLKGVFKAGRAASLPRKILVVTQFTASIALILGTLIVFKQIQHAKDRPVGYGRAGLVSTTLYMQNPYKNYGALRTALLQTGAVQDLAESSSGATHIDNNYGDLDWKGKDPKLNPSFGMIAVTHDFGHTYGWQIKEGRDFSRAFPTDSGTFILNESAAKLVGFQHPVGEVLNWEGKTRTITGVVKDLVMESPYEPVKPTIFFLQYNDWLSYLTIRLNPLLPAREALARIEPVFKSYNAGSPFDYRFVDEEYSKKFAEEEQIGELASIFAGLAIFISCLGLFGLASFMAEQRTKEIGVRKVLGASVYQLWKLLSWDFVRLVLVAFLISTPLAYILMRQWLQHYTYRTDLSWWVFAVTGVGAVMITLGTVSIQAIKAAMAKPWKSLRTE